MEKTLPTSVATAVMYSLRGNAAFIASYVDRGLAVPPSASLAVRFNCTAAADLIQSYIEG